MPAYDALDVDRGRRNAVGAIDLADINTGSSIFSDG
jgi:hypothetical protein